MIDMKTAVRSARAAFDELVGGGQIPTSLEEIEISDDRSLWRITLGYEDPALPKPEPSLNPFSGGVGGLLQMRRTLRYKLFQINAETGEVLSMKIRIP